MANIHPDSHSRWRYNMIEARRSKGLKEAFIATSKHRGSYDKTSDYRSIEDAIRNDGVMQQRWKGYQKQMPNRPSGLLCSGIRMSVKGKWIIL